MKPYQLLPLLTLPLMGQETAQPFPRNSDETAPAYNLLLHGESLNSVLNREFATPHNNWEPFFGLSEDSQDCLGQSLSEFQPTHHGYRCPTGPWFMVQIPMKNQPTLCCIGRTGSASSCLLYFFEQDSTGTRRVAEVVSVSFWSTSPFFQDWIVTQFWAEIPSHLEHNSNFPAKTPSTE